MNNAAAVRKKRLRVLVLWNRGLSPGPQRTEAELPAGPSALGRESTGTGDLGRESTGTGDLGDLGSPSPVPAVPFAPDPPAAVRAVTAALQAQGWEVTAVDAEDDIDRISAALVIERPGLIFNLVDEFYGDNTQHAAVAAYLDLLGVSYTGAEAICLATCQDRVRVHLLLADGGVPVPGFKVIRDINAIPDVGALRRPWIVTQAFDDVYEQEGTEQPLEDWSALVDQVAALATEYDLPFLIEEYLAPRRIHAIVMGDRSLEVLPLVEFDPAMDEDDYDDEDSAFDDDAGDDDQDAATEPDRDDPEVLDPQDSDLPSGWILAQVEYHTADRIRELARRAFRVLGCRDVAQIDFHLDDCNAPYVVDVRPLIDFGTDGPFYMAAASTDRGYIGTVAEIVNLAYQRSNGAEDEDDGPEANTSAVPHSTATATGAESTVPSTDAETAAEDAPRALAADESPQAARDTVATGDAVGNGDGADNEDGDSDDTGAGDAQ